MTQGVKLSKLIRHELYGCKPSQGLTALFNPYVINVAADSIYAIKFIYADNNKYL